MAATQSDRARDVVISAGVLSVAAAGVHAVGSWVPSVPEVLGCPAAISGSGLLVSNGGMIGALLVFGYVSLFHPRELLATRLGRGLMGCIITFWILRAAIEFFLVDVAKVGFLVVPLCLGMAALYLVPLLWIDPAPGPQGGRSRVASSPGGSLRTSH